MIAAISGHKDKEAPLNNDDYISAIELYAVYFFFGIWFKGFVYDLEDTRHTQRICTKYVIYFCLVLKVCANILLANRFCQGNKRGIIFVVMLFLIYFIQLSFNFIVYFFKIKFLLRTYWLGFLFYQISRFCILLFFIFSFLLEANHVETYIYAGILCIISAYMYMANYFNTLMKDILYNSYLQAIFNYPMEWMNLFCCFCTNPKDFIMEIDYKYCCCDSFFLALGECIKTCILAVLYVLFYLILCICDIACSVSNEQE